jgi:hypothetical protein
MGESINTYRILVRNPEGKVLPFVKPMRRWNNIVKMNLMEIRYMSLNWIYLVLYRGEC